MLLRGADIRRIYKLFNHENVLMILDITEKDLPAYIKSCEPKRTREHHSQLMQRTFDTFVDSIKVAVTIRRY